MKFYFLFALFFLIISCNNNKSVYWCGDHACVNKKEKDAYFKKTMVVEIKNEKNIQDKDKSEINKIVKQAKLNEKKRMQNEKSLIIDEKLEEKILIKSKKALTKQAKIDEKKLLKNNISKNQNKILVKNNVKKALKKTINTESNTFSQIVKKIRQRNMIKDYPDINNLPN